MQNRGYSEKIAEYLKIHIRGGKTDGEKILSVVENIENAAKRLEHYTESIRAINHIEELEVKRESVDFGEVFPEISDDFSNLGGDIRIICENNVVTRTLNLDKQALYRILENIVGNAVRFAKSEIRAEFSLEGEKLRVTVSDDGGGFPEKVLNSDETGFINKSDDVNHTGIGLQICRILARKHGGQLILSNENGAVVKIYLSVKF